MPRAASPPPTPPGFTFLGGRLWLDLVNTDDVRQDVRVDTIGEFDRFVAWLLTAGVIDADRADALQRRAIEQPSGAAAALVEVRRLRAALRALAEACREPDLKLRWSRIEQLVDVDAFVQFMALEAMLCHWDGYSFNSNNYRLYFEPDRKARFLAHGMDQCFQQPDMSVLDAPRAMLAASVMRNPEWRKDYRREIKKLLPKFSPQRAKRLVEPVQRRLSETLKEIDPELAASQLAESRALLERVAARARSLTAQSTAPEPKPLVFRKNTPVLVKDWRPMSEVDDAALETIDADGARWMRVACGPSGRCIAGWRRGVLLAKGKYVLEAVVRTEAVGRLEEEGAPGAGAGIRISGKTREGVGGTDGPRKIRFPFEVTEELADIELVIELRSAGGWAAFRVDSLVLERD